MVHSDGRVFDSLWRTARTRSIPQNLNGDVTLHTWGLSMFETDWVLCALCFAICMDWSPMHNLHLPLAWGKPLLPRSRHVTTRNLVKQRKLTKSPELTSDPSPVFLFPWRGASTISRHRGCWTGLQTGTSWPKTSSRAKAGVKNAVEGDYDYLIHHKKYAPIECPK